MAAPLIPLIARLAVGSAGRAALTRTAGATASRATIARTAGGKAAAEGAKRPAINYGDLMTAGMGGGKPKVQEAQQKSEQQQKGYDDQRRAMEGEKESREKVTGALKKMAIGVTSVFGALYASYVGVVKLPKAFSEWGRSLEDGQRNLGRYSGTIQASLARLQVQRIKLGIKTARGTEGSAAGQLKAVGEFNKAFEPLKQDLTTVFNKVTGEIMGAAATVVSAINLLTSKNETIREILDRWEKEARDPRLEGMPAQDWVDSLQRGQGAKPNRKPLPPIR